MYFLEFVTRFCSTYLCNKRNYFISIFDTIRSCISDVRPFCIVLNQKKVKYPQLKLKKKHFIKRPIILNCMDQTTWFNIANKWLTLVLTFMFIFKMARLRSLLQSNNNWCHVLYFKIFIELMNENVFFINICYLFIEN